jgi:hypothetical protein
MTLLTERPLASQATMASRNCTHPSANRNQLDCTVLCLLCGVSWDVDKAYCKHSSSVQTDMTLYCHGCGKSRNVLRQYCNHHGSGSLIDMDYSCSACGHHRVVHRDYCNHLTGKSYRSTSGSTHRWECAKCRHYETERHQRDAGGYCALCNNQRG